MSCPECREPSNRPHRQGCSYGPLPDDREQFIRDNAVALVESLQALVRRQRRELKRFNRQVSDMKRRPATEAQ